MAAEGRTSKVSIFFGHDADRGWTEGSGVQCQIGDPEAQVVLPRMKMM